MMFERKVSKLGACGVVLALLGVVGCADPAARFEEFGARYTELNPPVVSAACADNPCAQPAAGAIDGTYLWTVSTEFGPTTPILFHAELTTVAAADGLTLTFTAIPLSSTDRTTEVGTQASYGPYNVPASGCFEAAHVAAPGTANPHTGTELAADILLAGQICAGTPLICGLVTGNVTAPVQAELTKSTFTFDPATAPGQYTEPPVINCAGDLAAPL
jgi:hypothetical protein